MIKTYPPGALGFYPQQGSLEIHSLIHLSLQSQSNLRSEKGQKP